MGIEQLMVTASITIIVLMLAIIFLFVFKWKIAFSGVDGDKVFDIVPSGLVDENTRSFKKLKKEHRRFAKHQEKIAKAIVEKNVQIANQLIASDQAIQNDQEKANLALQAVLSTIRDLREETKILREEIQSQAAELDRHRKGYDVDILSTSLISIARMHRVLLTDLRQPDLSIEAKSTLDLLEDECLEVFETKGVRLVRPIEGELYRNQKNIQHPPKKVDAPDTESVDQIANILHPAYELETSARNVVLLPAIVEVYTGDRKQVEDQPDITKIQNEGSNNG